MNLLAKIGVGFFAIFIAFSMISQCGRRSAVATQQEARSTEVILREYAKGLDLAAITELAKKAKNAADLERLINSQTEAVNNIDLNDDDKVDYINVTEYGSGDKRGFSLTDEISPGKVQEIATIDIQREGEQATVQTTGNPSLYGPSHYHHSSFGLSDALLMGWLFSNHTPYNSPYGYGNYPPSYGSGWNRQDQDSYAGSMRSRTAGSTIQKSARPVISNPAASPNAEKIAAKAKAISSPTHSQRSFSSPSSSPSSSSRSGTSSSARPTGGFGRSSSFGASRSGGFSRGGK